MMNERGKPVNFLKRVGKYQNMLLHIASYLGELQYIVQYYMLRFSKNRNI